MLVPTSATKTSPFSKVSSTVKPSSTRSFVIFVKDAYTVPLFQAPSSVPDPADVHPNPTPSRRPAPGFCLQSPGYPPRTMHAALYPKRRSHPPVIIQVFYRQKVLIPTPVLMYCQKFSGLYGLSSFAEAARCSMPPAFSHTTFFPASSARKTISLCTSFALRTGRCPLFRPRAVLPGIHMYVNRHSCVCLSFTADIKATCKVQMLNRAARAVIPTAFSLDQLTMPVSHIRPSRRLHSNVPSWFSLLIYCFLCHCANHTSFNFISIQLLQTSNIVPFLSIFVSSCEERFFALQMAFTAAKNKRAQNLTNQKFQV